MRFFRAICLAGFVTAMSCQTSAAGPYVIDAVTVGHRGTIHIGEIERISKLYLFYPW